jgi:hypothetical protein
MSATLRTLFATTAVLFGASIASAQATPPVSLPGTVDAGKASAATRSDQEAFNRAAGQIDHSGDRNKKKRERAVPATAADIVAGAEVRDAKGVPVGKVQSIDAEGVIVATSASPIRVPLEAFGKNSKGLLLGITKAEFDTLVANATAKPQG